MAGIEKYYEITEVYAWQWDGNTNITIEDIPEELTLPTAKAGGVSKTAFISYV